MNLSNKKILAIVPARKGSKGLKDKNIKKFAGKPLIYWSIKSVQNSKYINKLIVSTDSKKIQSYCKSIKVDVPFLRPKKISRDKSKSIEFILHALKFFKKKNEFFDYVVLLEPTSPLTTNKDIDKALLKLHNNRDNADSIVGVSENINHHPSFNVKVNKLGFIKPLGKKFLNMRRQNISKLFFYDGSLYISKTNNLVKNKSFYQSRTLAFKTEKWKSIEIDDIIDFVSAEALFKNKKNFMNNLGQKLLKKAQKIIPGGNQLLSKRSEMFLPGLWPTYYSSSVGCLVKDLNKKKYYDFAGMGVTSCILGYADKDINRAVINGLKKGSMSTLNAPEEFDLAKKLIEIHKWADMVRFSKSGGEACLIAIRIARAFSNKEKIAFCGYHGWHDWYMSANLENKKSLDEQLLPGLGNKGISKSFKNSIFAFQYNDIESLKKIFNKQKNEIGVVIMEPMRFTRPKDNFLKKVKKLSKKNGAILIFDEITSGFHENYGGLHLKFKVNPDMAIFGKALGNGYPISAVIGKRNIMDFAQRTFISSTMWTDRLGFIAGLSALKKMKKLKVQKKLVNIGRKIKKGWLLAANKNKIKISVGGLDSLPNFRFEYDNNKEISTFFTQEMLKLGFLAKEALATTYVYNDKIIKKYFTAVNFVFNKINLINQKKIKFPLKGPIKHSTLKRITY